MYLLHDDRPTQSLDGTWQAIPDPYRWFEDNWFEDRSVPLPADPPAPADYDVDDGYPVTIPGSWGEQLPEFRHFEGLVWHTRRFDWQDDADRVFLRIGAANYATDVWLNDTYLGSHEGGYTPFSFEGSEAIESTDNLLVVAVDNERQADGIPEQQTDWFNFGGITRSVELIPAPTSYLRNAKVTGIIEAEGVTVETTAWVDGDPPETVSVTIPALGTEATLEPTGTDGEYHRFGGTLALDREAVSLWSPANPRLYTVRFATPADELAIRTGFRTVNVQGMDVLVNGEAIDLRGISMHEEAAGRGRTLSRTDIDSRFEWLAELGCNFARLAHYPHTPAMARRADEEGILLWEEVPAYWQVAFESDHVRALHRDQLTVLIQRDWNRPSVIMWSIANETDHEDRHRNEALRAAVDHVRALDDSRLVTAACWVDETEAGLELRDPLADKLDVVGVNEYYGWYGGEADDLDTLVDGRGPPIVISETGAGAKWGNHGNSAERWTEEFQAVYYRTTLETIDGIDRIVGVTPWILFDFRSPRRVNPHQRGYNRKGILDERGRKKLAFEVLSEHYRSE